MSTIQVCLGLLGVIVLIATAVIGQRRKYASAHLPPGPPSHWFSGTPLPKLYPWRHFHSLAQRYSSELITIWTKPSSPTVVVSSMAAADALLEKSARHTADRPFEPLASDIFSHGRRILLIGHGERWRRLRRALHNPLAPAASKQVRDKQESLARGVVRDITSDADNWQQHVQTYAASLVVYMAYGRASARYSDPDIVEVVRGGARLGTLLRPGAFLANRIPLLRYVPGYLRTVNVWADDELRLFRGALAEFKQRQRSDPNVPVCFAGFLLENQASLELDNDDIAYLLGSVFGAGSDTSSSAIAITIMAAATHRAEADAVRTELDALPEPPTFADLDDATALPRLRAFVAETFRWRPVSSGGFAHATTAELTHASKAGNEYVIPGGTTIIGNHWGLARDTAYYGEDVEAFRPSRWVREDGSFNDKMKTHQFGFGRRVCPGQHVALNSVLINAALLLWAFEIGEVKGKAIDTLAFTNTANSHPLPFAVQWKARKEVPCEEES